MYKGFSSRIILVDGGTQTIFEQTRESLQEQFVTTNRAEGRPESARMRMSLITQ
jgi:hypothetical protein